MMPQRKAEHSTSIHIEQYQSSVRPLREKIELEEKWCARSYFTRDHTEESNLAVNGCLDSVRSCATWRTDLADIYPETRETS